jgi:hypothetical protein
MKRQKAETSVDKGKIATIGLLIALMKKEFGEKEWQDVFRQVVRIKICRT